MHPVFCKATEWKRRDLERLVNLRAAREITAMDAEPTDSLEPRPFFVVEQYLEFVRSTVYYQGGPDVRPGERLAPWTSRGMK